MSKLRRRLTRAAARKQRRDERLEGRDDMQDKPTFDPSQFKIAIGPQGGSPSGLAIAFLNGCTPQQALRFCVLAAEDLRELIAAQPKAEASRIVVADGAGADRLRSVD